MPVRHVALATKHGKLAQIAPAFARLSDWQLQLAEIDTDCFGTFSGEVARTASPKQTAIAKAKAGAAAAGSEFGLASEGSIGPHPAVPFVTVDFELMALVCPDRDLVVVETHLATEIRANTLDVRADFELDELARKLDLPAHGAIAQADVDGATAVHKGIHEPSELRRVLRALFDAGAVLARVENDYRAMHSPSRQRNIAQCAEKLVDRIAQHCPACSEIGWGFVRFEYGLPCRACGLLASSVPRARVHGCVRCPAEVVAPLDESSADPARCDNCNP